MSRDFTIERDWITEAGLRAVVIMGSMGSRCGYVGVPPGHPLHGQDYSEPSAALFPIADDEPIGKRSLIALLGIAVEENARLRPDAVFDVHGGITFSGGHGTYPVEADLWWFGYDCAHSGDGMTEEYLQSMRDTLPGSASLWRNHPGDVVRSLDYCVAECESLARQIATYRYAVAA